MLPMKAILVVSFGTSYLDALDKNIKAIEETIQTAYPNYKLYRAFTSKMIIKKLKLVHDIKIDTVPQAIERMLKDGITDLIVQPTHIINGIENDSMIEEIKLQKDKFNYISFGMPLLSTTNDYLKVVDIIAKYYKPANNDILILMGHGTTHYANSVYPALDYTFKQQGYSNIFVGTVEGYPDIKDVISLVDKQNASNVTLLPLMLVAGDHAQNDMASDDEDSWKSQVKQQGYEVHAIVKGLGEIEEIRNLYLEHIAEALR
ncbi:MAG: sirohydrochlorin cobaltochelatase [Lachnotalea sp.]